MDPSRTFTKEEISNILTLASRIQNRKDLNQDQMALTVEDLRYIAAEVGIDHDSLQEAILNADAGGPTAEFQWLGLSSTLLKDQTVAGEITDDDWEDVVQEIRRITGIIGKPGKVGKSFEWEQPESDSGIEKHLALSPQNGSTRIRYIAQWKAFEIVLMGFSMIVGSGLGMFLFNLFQLSGTSFFTLPFIGGLAGLGTSRLFLHHYFERQKAQYSKIVAAIEKRLRRSSAKKSMLDELETENEAERSRGRDVDAPLRL